MEKSELHTAQADEPSDAAALLLRNTSKIPETAIKDWQLQTGKPAVQLLPPPSCQPEAPGEMPFFAPDRSTCVSIRQFGLWASGN